MTRRGIISLPPSLEETVRLAQGAKAAGVDRALFVLAVVDRKGSRARPDTGAFARR
jgi:hypothetical protein